MLFFPLVRDGRESRLLTPVGCRSRPADAFRSLWRFGVFNAVQSVCFDTVRSHTLLMGERRLIRIGALPGLQHGRERRRLGADWGGQDGARASLLPLRILELTRT